LQPLPGKRLLVIISYCITFILKIAFYQTGKQFLKNEISDFMIKSFDVLIIGAGVAGAAIARELSRYKLKIALVEKETDVSFGTSKANSGIIHAGFHSEPGTLKAKLCQPGNELFDDLCDELEFPFERHGELMVAFSEEEIRILQTYYERGQNNKVPSLELIGREKLLELEPNLNPDVMGALHAPTAGVICPYEYCFALVGNAVENGVELFTDSKVTWLGKKKSGEYSFELETENGLSLSTRFVINAAGLYADEIARFLGVADFRINPRKGEEYLLDRRVGSLVRKVIFPVPTKKSKGMLVIPTVDGPVMVGPTAVDIEDKDDFSTSREGLKQVFQHAQKMVPGIRTTDIITSFVGLRPAATGGDFIIGTTKIPGFINAAGIQSPGLTASPAIAKMIADILKKEGLRLDAKKGFKPRKRESFTKVRHLIDSRKYDEFIKIVAKDHNYSKLVCRCENVTEAEIIAAVKRGHTTLDGIKFATRAGTGRCQGGFCTSRVMEIIRRETGLPFEKISKKGKGSEVVLYPLEKGTGK
jgi:glycerol-3-phosphate dehydrogenase